MPVRALRNTRSPRVQRRKDKTRQILLDVSLGLFHEKGIYWTKIEDITERADIGKGTFYHYFATKENLLQVLLQHGFDLLVSRMKEGVRSASDRRRLSALVGMQLDFYLQHPEILLLFHQVRGLLMLKVRDVSALKKTYNSYLDRLAALLRPALSKTTSEGARNTAMALSAFTTGLLTYHLVAAKAGSAPPDRDAIRRQIERSMQALTAAGGI